MANDKGVTAGPADSVRTVKAIEVPQDPKRWVLRLGPGWMDGSLLAGWLAGNLTNF